MAQDPYVAFNDGDSGGDIRAIINKVGGSNDIAFKRISAIASVASEVGYFIDSAIVYADNEEKFYYYNGSSWVEHTALNNFVKKDGDTMTGNLVFTDVGIDDADFVQFNITYADGTAEGKLQWNLADGTLEVGMPGGNVNLQIGQEVLLRATNDQGVQINNGQLVRISGGTGNFADVKLADKSYIYTAGTMGFATENIANGQKGYITNFGLVRDVDTDGMAAGSLLWLDDDGGYTTTVPTAPDIKVIVGIVIRSHDSEGIIFATIHNVARLSGLSDITFTSIADNDLVVWDSASSTFINQTLQSVVDMYISASGIKAPGSKPATFVESGLTGVWQFADEGLEANQESVSGTLKLPTKMVRTEVPVFKVGWSADGISPGNCEWQLEYLYISPNEDTSGSAQETLTVIGTASSTSNGFIVTSFSGIDLPESTDQAMFFKIKRLSAGSNDTISDTVELRGMLFTYTENILG